MPGPRNCWSLYTFRKTQPVRTPTRRTHGNLQLEHIGYLQGPPMPALPVMLRYPTGGELFQNPEAAVTTDDIQRHIFLKGQGLVPSFRH